MLRPLLLGVIAAFALAGCGAPPSAKAPAGCVLDLPDTIGGPINLVDQTGAAITEARFAGRPALVYFGFTFCPDICPASLQTARAALDAAGPLGATIQPILVSLDPSRDTPETMAAYVSAAAFPEGLVGLTGSESQTAAAAKTFRVMWRRNETPESAAEYLIDHSSNFYLMDSAWRAVALFPSTLPPEDQAACMRAGLQGN